MENSTKENSREAKQTEEEQQINLKDLVRQPGNSRCADCQAHGIFQLTKIRNGHQSILDASSASDALVCIVKWEFISLKSNLSNWTLGTRIGSR